MRKKTDWIMTEMLILKKHKLCLRALWLHFNTKIVYLRLQMAMPGMQIRNIFANFNKSLISLTYRIIE